MNGGRALQALMMAHTRRGLLGAAAAMPFAAQRAMAQQQGAAPRQPTAQPPRPMVTTPFLLVAPDMHVGPIRRIAVSGDGSLVATASGDKSIRLWNGRTGTLVHTLRVPMNEEAAGAIEGLALTPDGAQLAAASFGFDAPEDSRDSAIYPFALQAKDGWVLRGRLRLTGRNVPTQLSFGPQCLAGVLSDGELMLWSGSNFIGMPPAVDRGRPLSGVAAAAFAPDGTLWTITGGGLLRALQIVPDPVTRAHSATVQSRIMVPPDGEADQIAISSDGLRIAIGYFRDSKVRVVDLRTRRSTVLRKPEGLSEGNLAAVAWGSGEDGRSWLFAAGTVQDHEQRNVILAWQEGRQGVPERIAVCADAINHLQAMPTGGVLFASADPCWGHVIVHPGGGLGVRLMHAPVQHDMRSTRDGSAFIVDPSGTRVAVRLKDGWLGFDLKALTLLDANEARGLTGVTAHRLGQQITIEHVDISSDPRVNGVLVPLDRGERMLAADTVAGRLALIGTDYRLWLMNPQGRVVARRRIATAAWGVVSPNSNLAVVAHGDGTIRWYAMTADAQLREIAGLFVHADRKRWVAWRSDGLFAHSDFGGERLVGYHVNGSPGREAQRWLTFGQMYRAFYRPGAVASVLDDPGSWEAIANRTALESELDGLQLPKIHLKQFCPLDDMPGDVTTRSLLGADLLTGSMNSAATCSDVGTDAFGLTAGAAGLGVALPAGTRAVRLMFEVTDPGDGVVAIDAMINGQNGGRIELTAPAQGGVYAVERVVPLIGTTNTVTIRATGTRGMSSESQPLHFRIDAASPSDHTGRRLWILSAGVDRYVGGSVPELRSAVLDATRFVDTVTAVKPAIYGASQPPRVMIDSEVSRGSMAEAFADLARSVRPTDAVLVYLAGHGVTDNSGTYWFLPPQVTDLGQLSRKAISHGQLVEWLGELASPDVFLFLDTCHAGAFNLGAPGNLANECGRFVLTAAATLEAALDSYDEHGGVFARAVQLGLRGEALAGDRFIDALNLGVYVRRQVPKLAAIRNHRQQAVFKAAGGDLREFVLAEHAVSGRRSRDGR
jgi:WD40 repeat protein